MTTLKTRTKDAIVGIIAAGVQGRIQKFVNFAVGSAFLALAEAKAGVALWLQAEIAKVLLLTRAATSDGDDLHTWMADYDLEPLPAIGASGPVVFSRFTAGAAAVPIPVGTIAQTADGTQRFAVYADPSHPAYVAGTGYVMGSGVASITVPVRALVSGVAGNVVAGAVSLIGSALPGVDAVTNGVAFVNGLDGETDESLRASFRLYIASLRGATEDAIRYAVVRLRQGLQCEVANCRTPDGTFEPGFFTVHVDDGTGALPQDILDAARLAVDAIRAGGVRAAVVRATPVEARVSMVLEVAPGYHKPDLIAIVTTALSTYIGGLGLGEKLRFSRLEQVAYDAHRGVTNVSSTLLNGARDDLIPSIGQTIVARTIVIS